MRSIPAAISNALSSSGAQPSLAVTVQQLQRQWSLLATNTNTPTGGFTAACVTAAGTILRFTMGTGAGAAGISVERITSPATAGQWTGTKTLITSTARATAGCSAAAATGLVRLFYYVDASNTVVYRDSSDDGVTWSAEQALPASPWTGTNYCYGLTAASTTQVLVASAGYAGFDQAAAILYQTVQSAGVWGAWSNTGPPSPTWGQIRGLSSYLYTNGYVYYVAGAVWRTQQTGCGAVSFARNNAGAFGNMTQVAAMDNRNLGLTYMYPAIAPSTTAGSAGNVFWAAVMLQDDGSVSGTAQTRVGIWSSLDGASYTLDSWLGNVLATNAAIVVSGGQLYVFDASKVYVTTAAPAQSDVSNDVLALDIDEKDDEAASVRLTLANQSGQYSGGSFPPNATVTIALGYNGTTITTHTLYVDDVTLVSSPGNQTAEISARSISKLLDQVCPRFIAWSNLSLSTLIGNVCAAARVPLDPLPTTAQFSQTVPCLMVQPGDTWRTIMKRLSNLYGFNWLDRATPSVKIVERTAGDASTWSYADESLGVAWTWEADQATLIRVVGSSGATTPAFADITDDTAILLSGGERYRHIVERMLTTSAQCKIRAGLAMREEQVNAQHGTITVSVNPQLELIDVVAVNQPLVGLSTVNTRISGIHIQIDMHTGEWLQHLTLTLP